MVLDKVKRLIKGAFSIQIGEDNITMQNSEIHIHPNEERLISVDIKTNLKSLRNNRFTGRVKHIEKLRQALISINKAVLTQVIIGAGGVGKTQIALEYLFMYWSCYETIWWINAETITSVSNEYRNFAITKELIHKDNYDADWITLQVSNWLMSNKNWIFVYDNAENNTCLSGYLPSVNNSGHIIITSRASDWDFVGEVLDVGAFESEEAVEFIIKRTGIDNKKEAEKLSKELGNFPLALEQAGAYIAKNKKSLEEYNGLLSKSKMNLLANGKYKPYEYNHTVATTWNISLGKIHNSSSIQLLTICSFLASDNILESSRFFPKNPKLNKLIKSDNHAMHSPFQAYQTPLVDSLGFSIKSHND